jgi:uncharacterized protein YcnI
MKKWIGLLLAMIFTLSFGSIANAHVTVYPKEAVQGSYEKFTVRVPTEKEVPTVKVEIKIPIDVDISKFEPKAGWKYDIVKDSSGKITSVVWTAMDAGLGPTEFGEFNMQGKVADSTTTIAWKAYQTYKDGTVVEWTGAPGSDKPASVTSVTPKAAGTAKNSLTAGGELPLPTSGVHEKSILLLVYLSIILSFLAILAVIISLVKQKKRKKTDLANDERYTVFHSMQ